MLWQQGAPAAPRPQSGGLIAGQIRTSDNALLPAIRVQALVVPSGNTRPEEGPNYYNAGPPASTALTDAQGRFRLENVPAGRYYIMAGTTRSPTYYPDAIDMNQRNATIITVTAGQTIDNIDFKLLGTAGHRLSGRLNFNAGVSPDQTITLTSSAIQDIVTIPASAGTFDFGRVPPGLYLLTTYPQPSGLAPFAVSVRNDVTNVVLTSPPTRTVTGKIVMQNGGPIPAGILGFYNVESYVSGTVHPDGTFTAKLHASRHRVDVAGMPVGYDLASVRIGSTDATRGFTVSNADISDVVVTVAAPKVLPRLRGTVTGLAPARLAEARVELTGPVFGTLQASIRPDGAFEFPIMVPGLYKVRLSQVPEFTPVDLVVTDQALTTATLTVRAK
jgi:hypothetical protein